MLNTKNDWASLFIFSYTKKPLGLEKWKKILNDFVTEPITGSKTTNSRKKLDIDSINVYSESISNKDNKDGTFNVISGKWKGRYSNGMPYIEVVKANFRKADHKPITPDQLKAIKEFFRGLKIPDTKIDHLGIDYYPYKDPFRIDKGLPKNPELPFDWSVVGIVAAVVGGIAIYKYNKKNA